MGDQQKNWMIRRDGALEGPYTEYELRKRLMGSVLNQLEIRQGSSDWFPATAVWSKFKELARAGIYLRADGKEQGPYTAARALQLLRHAQIDLVDARVGPEGHWMSGDELLDHLERLGRTAAEKAQANKAIHLSEGTRPRDRQSPRIEPSGTVGTGKQEQPSRDVYTLRPSGRNLPARSDAMRSSSDQANAIQRSALKQRSLGRTASEANSDPTDDGATSHGFAEWQRESGADVDANPADAPEELAVAPEEEPNQLLDYPRLPNQQNPAMYFVPGMVIATSGFVMFAYTLLAVMTERPGIALFTTSMIPPGAAVGFAATVVINVVFLILDAVMTLGAITMAMQKNLTLSRAGAVLATIPCVGLVVMPFGIWACVALFTRRAERDFS